MSGENTISSFPPPTDPPARHRPTPKKRGSVIVLGGVIFGFLPLIIPLVASISIDDALNEGSSTLGTLPWFTFVTLPIGCVIVFIGLITGAWNVIKRNRL